MNTIDAPGRIRVLCSLLLLAAFDCAAQERTHADKPTYGTEQGGGSLSKFELGNTARTAAGVDDGGVRYTGMERGFGFVYSASDHVNVYGLRRRAFEAPAMGMYSQRVRRDNPGLDYWLRPRSVGDTEIGLKARISHGLTASLSAFRNDSEDEFGSRMGPAGLYTGRSRREGVEFSLDNKWANGLGASLSYSLSRNSYSDSYCGNVCVSLARSGTYGRTFAADQVVYGELSWHYPRFGLVTAFEAKYVGRGYADGLNSDQTAAYFVANARLGLEQQAGRWRLREFARVDNIAGRNYFGLSGNDSGLRLIDPAATRNYSIGISAGYSW